MREADASLYVTDSKVLRADAPTEFDLEFPDFPDFSLFHQEPTTRSQPPENSEEQVQPLLEVINVDNDDEEENEEDMVEIIPVDTRSQFKQHPARMSPEFMQTVNSGRGSSQRAITSAFECQFCGAVCESEADLSRHALSVHFSSFSTSFHARMCVLVLILSSLCGRHS